MIEVEGLVVSRGGRRVIEGCDFVVPKGGILAVLGANGVGKTTLLMTLIGVHRPDAGRCTVGGRTGYVPQLYDVAFSYTAMDIALMGRARHVGLFGAPRQRDYAVVRRFFALMGIADLEERTFNTLSGGQRQLVMIAQALASECEVLILDEPCAALDYKNQRIVIDLLDRLSREHDLTVVFTTHAPQHAVEIASDVLLMYPSAPPLGGARADVLNAANLSALYGVPIGRADFVGREAYTYAPLYGHAGDTAR
ncbi:ABC transporter ATP-binding protein [Acuticoccus mangrovi]|uniref:ABC transporter ATP-binding protein n=1 Tax=Acuticoccus mangrovi TaxID=2796142 RepID=A0A934ITF4_9HYPH|nr:ABC transporter ATP-binding protein [Acuticoccus mangrovi]